MADISNDQNLKDCVANGIPSRAFRYAVESKNVLSAAGDMYVGTGLTRTTTMKLSNDTLISYDSYITAVLHTPSSENYTLQTVACTIKTDASDNGATVYLPCWVSDGNTIKPEIKGQTDNTYPRIE